jgi:hypothetical protein
MSFQAYIDAVERKTGKTVAQLTAIAKDKKLLAADGGVEKGVRAGDVVAWLAADYGLGRGHAMSIWALFSGLGKTGDA